MKKQSIIILMTLLLLSITSYSQGFFKKKAPAEPIVAMFDGSYVKIGFSLSDFIVWAKSIDKWHPYDVIKNGDPNDDKKYHLLYTINESRTIEGKWFSERYKYYFKNDICIAVKISPNSHVNYKNELNNKGYFFIKEFENESGKHIESYKNKVSTLYVYMNKIPYENTYTPGEFIVQIKK